MSNPLHISFRASVISVLALFFLAGCSHSEQTSIQWKEGVLNNKTGKSIDTLYIVNPPVGEDWSIWFCQFASTVKVLDGSDADIEYWNGSLYRIVPNKTQVEESSDSSSESEDQDATNSKKAKKQKAKNPESKKTSDRTLQIIYEFRNQPRISWAPEGFALQYSDGTSVNIPAEYTYQPSDDIPDFKYNPVELEVTDMVPQVKSVELLSGVTTIGNEKTWNTSIVEGKRSEWYRITLNGEVNIEASDDTGLYYAGVTIENLMKNSGGQTVPSLIIEDWPDLPFRGMMLDVSRNFTTKDNILKLIDLLSHYKVNVLHLHLGDDEGWRLEIDGLEELTSYGGIRDIPVIDENGIMTEPNGLMPSYSGGANDGTIPGSGYYTRKDFIEILKYATKHHMKVIPEFDTPGHSRAAIKAMEKRYERTNDATYLLSERTDSSKYKSVQYYTDNAINVALPSTYAFISKVFDEIISMYKEAEAPLTTIHIGGDEVPSGAWIGSPSCQRLMQKNGWEDPGMLKDYYISKVMDIAASKGIKISGWQEVTQHLSEETTARLTKDMEYTNLWSTLPGAARKDEIPYKLANSGVNVVLSDVQNTYADLAYNHSRLERGHSWGGFIDERRAFSLLPYDLYLSVRWDDYGKKANLSKAYEDKTLLNPGAQKHIIGVQAQLWTETTRDFDHVTYYIFPKVVGIFERGWNANPSWSQTTVSDDPEFMEAFDRYYSIIEQREYPYYNQMGINYRQHRNE